MARNQGEMEETGLSSKAKRSPKLSLSIVKLGHSKAANRHNRVESSDDIFVIYDQSLNVIFGVEMADVATTYLRVTVLGFGSW